MQPLERKIRDLWPLLLGEGILIMALGMTAVLLPALVGLAIAVLLGWLLIVTSLADGIVTMALPQRPGLWLSLTSDILGLAVGGLLFTWPWGGVVSLSLALAAFLVLDGGFAVMLAMAHRRSRAAKWTWLAINGVLDFILAVVILVIPSRVEPWALGLIVGIDLLFAGATMVAMALDERGQVIQAHGPRRRAVAG